MAHIELTFDQQENLKRLARSHDLKFIVEIMKDGYKESWAATNPEDSRGREHLYSMIKLCDRFLGELQNFGSSDNKIIYNQKLKERLNGSYTQYNQPTGKQ